MSEDLTIGDHVRPTMCWSTPVMHETIRSVTEFGDELHKLIRDMFATMRIVEGVGLAATQMGVGVPVFTYECPDVDDRVQHGMVCNPVVEFPRGKDRNLDVTEGDCPSWPGGYSGVPRPDKVIYQGRGAYGKEIELLDTGLLIRCFRRGADHPNGVVFENHISGRSRRELDAQVADLVWRYPGGWPISPKRDSAPRPGEQ